MAISLKELIASQQQLQTSEKKQTGERMSIAEFRKLIGEAQNEAAQQTDVLETVSSTLKDEKVARLSQQTEEAKASALAKEVNQKTAEELNEIGKTLRKGLIENTAPKSLNTNMEKLLKETVKQSKSMDSLLKANEKAKGITEKSMGLEQFKTIRERGGDLKKSFKDFFTLKGFASKTGLTGKDDTGILATAINKRAAKQQYIKDRMLVDPNLKNLKQFGGSEKKVQQSLGAQFEKQQELRSSMRVNEKEISGLQKRGFTEEQIGRTKLIDTRRSIATEMEKADPRVRTAKKEERAETAKISKTAQKEETAKAENLVKKQTAVKEEKESREVKRKEVTALDFSDESELESSREMAKQTDLLTKIEENTRPGEAVAEGKPKEAGKSMLGGLIESIGSMLSTGLMSAAKFLFNPRNILKLIGKVFVPAMLIGSVINGLIDGFKVFFNGGTFVEALIAGLGGMLDFLTFGLIDAKTIQSIVDFVSGFVEDYIVKPIQEFVQTISDAFENYIMKPIEEFLSPLTNFFKSIKDSVMNFVTGFEIPGVSFTIPVINKEVALGPWKPFGEAKTSTATAPAPAEANAVYKKSGDNATAAVENNKSSAPVIVNAPTNVNNNTSKQNIAMPAPTRNTDRGLGRYVEKNTLFV